MGARAAIDKKAEDLVALDLQGLSAVADFFVVASGRSPTQVQTIAEAITLTLKAHGERPLHLEGVPESGWLLLDYGDVVIHVFLGETRSFYALERLWGDAPLRSVDALVAEG